MNQNQNQRINALMALRINGIKPIKALPGMNANQNQRYEVRMDFTGYECLMAFPVWHSPGRVLRKTSPTGVWIIASRFVLQTVYVGRSVLLPKQAVCRR